MGCGPLCDTVSRSDVTIIGCADMPRGAAWFSIAIDVIFSYTYILITIIFKQTSEVNQVFPTTCRVTG